MGKETEIIKSQLIDAFPNLSYDADFKITSNESSDYNCIAWAYKYYEDRIMWPGGQDCKTLDGFHYWPEGIENLVDENNPDVSAFIEAFQKEGFNICYSDTHEDNYERIALYVNSGTTICTHASREKRNGKWTSKLGPKQDIQHGSPYSLEGDNYGKVFCIMKRLFL